MDFLGKVINFVLLLGGLVYLLRKPLGNFLERRTRSLSQDLREAVDSRAEAERKQKEIANRLDEIGRDVEHIRQEAETEGRMIQERILQEANAEVERLKHLSHQEIEMLTQAGIHEIKRYAAELATILARQRIQRKMDKEDQSVLIDQSIERLGKLYEKSSSDQAIRTRTH